MRKEQRRRGAAPGIPRETVGIDLGTERSAYCVLDEAGAIREEGWMLTTRATLRAQWGGEREKGRVVIEACGLSTWVHEEFVALGYEVVVANPSKVALIGRNQQKSDQTDAYLLAKLGRADADLLCPVTPLGSAAHLVRSTVRLRHQVIDARVKLTNVVRGMGRTAGSPIPSCDAAHFTERARGAGLPADLRKQWEPMLFSIEGLQAAERRYDVMLQKLQRRPEYASSKILETVPGVGIVTAMTFILTIGDPTRFTDPRDVAAYLGLTPARKQSGESDPQLGITKAGDGYLRCLLVECAHRMLQDRSPACALRDWGRKLAQRGGKNGKRKAVVAVARKLAVLLYRLWQTQQPFEAYPAAGSSGLAA